MQARGRALFSTEKGIAGDGQAADAVGRTPEHRPRARENDMSQSLSPLSLEACKPVSLDAEVPTLSTQWLPRQHLAGLLL